MNLVDYYGGPWILESRCFNENVDPDIFTNSDWYREGRQFCATCPVKFECIEWGNENDIDALCGGKSLKERRTQANVQRRRLKVLQARMQGLLQDKEPPSAA